MGMGNPDLLASPKAAEEKPAFTHVAMNMLIGEYGPTQSLTHPCACGYDVSTSELLFSLCSPRPDSLTFHLTRDLLCHFTWGLEIGWDAKCACNMGI